MKEVKILTRDLTLHYGSKMALNSVNLDIAPNQVTALIVPRDAANRPFSEPSTG